jgi:membrane-bound serine protease (ClpP class)
MQALADTAWQLITNANIAYVFLILGLWSAVLAITAPGTGLPETAAVVCLSLAAVGLFNLPVSLVGLALIALSMVLFVAEARLPSHGALLLAGAIVMGVGGVLLFPSSDRSSAGLSWINIIGAPLLSSALFGFLISMGLAAQGRPALQDLRRLIGARGVTRTEVGRQGTVYVAGEEWSATAETKIPPDSDVVVLDRSGLRLKVAPAPLNAPAGASSNSPAGPA